MLRRKKKPEIGKKVPEFEEKALPLQQKPTQFPQYVPSPGEVPREVPQETGVEQEQISTDDAAIDIINIAISSGDYQRWLNDFELLLTRELQKRVGK